ncbi:hypothetical protein G3580_06445 [Nitrogeniibacter mangrovi]|uniref:Nitrate/nitrite sensing protein domain-containing protein n=1 Tax=Nitrogeniibacter mangrovi TaxID=2016596 RepID=A0A6C1B376_9RHOO|nr:nitrate- and nitrite sensing domain-containing protein [Nitrogeniibacter mangrovi]QID17315.1 hypothetical protein G3580_06445 [Nitrogeniibacter mangrovi]
MMIELASEPFLALASGVVAAGLIVHAVLVRRRAPAPVDAAEAVGTCRLMLGLVRNMQQHRGMSSAWLAGDAGFGPRMDARRRDITDLFVRLEQALESEYVRACPYPEQAAFEELRQQWQALVDGLAQRSAEDSITRHSFLIATVLDWLSGYGEARLAPLVQGSGTAAGVRSYTHRLPAVTEALGQARAIGSSVAARKGCSPVARVRLLFLIARAEALVAQSTRDPAVAGEAAVRDRARHCVAEMARVVRADMLMRAGVTVSADDYFALATQTIDAVFAWIEACGGALLQAETRAHPRAAPTSRLELGA